MARTLISLIRSPEGLTFLSAVVGFAGAGWWFAIDRHRVRDERQAAAEALAAEEATMVASAAPVSAAAAGETTTGGGDPQRDAELLAAAGDAAAVKSGRENYLALCQACHGPEGTTVAGPSNLFDPEWVHGGAPSQVEKTVLEGVLEKGMPGWGAVLPAEDTTAVVAYLLSFQKK